MQTSVQTMRAMLVLAAVGCGRHRAPEVASEVRVYHPPPVQSPSRPQVAGDPVEPPHAPLEEVLPERPVGVAPLPARVAVYAADEDFAQKLADTLEGLQGVEGTYVVPGYLLDGRGRWTWPYSTYGQPRTPLDLDRLREVAAMAHCDVLLVGDKGYRQKVQGNGWAALSPLVITLITTPLFKVEDQSYLDAHLIDVANGSLYGRIYAEQENERGPVTVYALDRPALREQQIEALALEARRELGDLLWYPLLQQRPPGGGWTTATGSEPLQRK